jgi:enoyl-CoA hydratase/carnithine racemase
VTDNMGGIPDLDPSAQISRVALAGPLLTAETAQLLTDACERAAGDDATRALVLTGAVPETFLVGATFVSEAERRLLALAVAALATLPKPTIAVLAGPAHGIGLELALACDLRVAAEEATFALPLSPAAGLPFCGGTQRLPRIIGRARTLDMMLTGRVVDAREALSWGLVVRTAPGPALADVTTALVREVLAGAPLALALAKEALLAAHDLPLAEGLRLEEDLYALLQTSADRAEGVRAFLAGRAPVFTGR